ncbi:hybrid sensor histidine kinase/response regulator [Xylanibacter muris]|uniref:histidine kinase n=1 Tax=Xylanibacter muris TaxID=2736290 RepID=A0ABX2AIE9_9BACT|nr:ATP-binding protein [Xylanibacter muris]NPD90788.1 response regulator [Xylanibacter muris]
MRKKTHIPLKVMLGYAFFIVLLGIAVWFVYRYTRTAVHLADVSRTVSVRWNAVNKLVHGIFEVVNRERSLCLGTLYDYDGYDKAVDKAICHADSMMLLLSDPHQRQRIDSLRILLEKRRENTLLFLSVVKDVPQLDVYEQKAERLLSGKDSVLIRSGVEENTEGKKVTYVVEKTGRNFFKRLANVFRRSRSDTTSIEVDTLKTECDTITRHINVGDDVATVLVDIGRDEENQRKIRITRYKERAEALLAVGSELTLRTEQIMSSISADEQHWLQQESEKDSELRRITVIKMAFLACMALLLAVILTVLVWRDGRLAAYYRISLERARIRAELLLEQRERLLLTITHDIKSPVASITGFTELLRQHVHEPRCRQYLHNITLSSQHLLQLVGALLDYSLLEKGRIAVREVSFSPSRLLSDCTESFRLRAEEKGLDLICEYTSNDNAVCKGDAFRIRQIAENLIGNALKYTSRGSVTVVGSVDDNIFCFRVTDTGQGMSADESSRVFKPFTRLPGAQGIDGVGLGLAITRNLINLLGGNLVLDTAPGCGSTFTVKLPVTEVEQDLSSVDFNTCCDEVDTSCPDASSAYICELRIAVVDDDTIQLQLIGEMLRRISGGKWKVILCSQIEQLFVMLDEQNPDMLLTDIEMPGMNGFELIRRLGERDMPVVAMTAYDGIADADFEKAGFAARLSKPVDTKMLLSVITKLAGKDTPDIPEHPDANDCSVSRFAALTAFADGDFEAEQTILRQFRDQTLQSIDTMRSAMYGNDMKTAASLAHRMIPVFTMIGSSVVPQLRALSSMRGVKNTPPESMDHCCKILSELEKILSELNNIVA